jgi:lactate dehydrogenase-like 2-hydroxyacid dehydrogenase
MGYREEGEIIMNVAVIGLGAIGSFMSMALSKAEIEHLAYDDDIVVDKNAQNQIYNLSDVNVRKAGAIEKYSDRVSSHTRMWNMKDGAGIEIAICCADDMPTRRDIARVVDVMFDTRLKDNQITLYASTCPINLLPSMDYENDDVPDAATTCHQPSSTLEVVLTAVGLMLANIKHYLNEGELLWGYAGIDVKNCTIVTTAK